MKKLTENLKNIILVKERNERDMKWYITGDTHGSFERFENFDITEDRKAVIILGDAGVDYYLGKRDRKLKVAIAALCPNTTFYLVRGNHEARPQDLLDIKEVYDPEVKGNVYIIEDFPHIKYLQDGAIYEIDGKRALVAGGAYSVDKWYRIANNWQWFQNEQLTAAERDEILNRVEGQRFDLVLTHTCPQPWQPTDLFLDCLDQSKVDTSMEMWLNDLKRKINYKLWCFAHYHEDRCVNYFSHMLFEKIRDLNELYSYYTEELQKGLSQ